MDELYKEVWINMDFTSLYPTAMKTFNIDIISKNKRILKIKKIILFKSFHYICKMVMARYNNIVVEVTYSGISKLDRKNKIKFIEFFEGDDKEFITKWRKDYPNHSFQIFKHPKKSLSKSNRELIENSLEVKQRLRDYNLSKLLDE